MPSPQHTCIQPLRQYINLSYIPNMLFSGTLTAHGDGKRIERKKLVSDSTHCSTTSFIKDKDKGWPFSTSPAENYAPLSRTMQKVLTLYMEGRCFPLCRPLIHDFSKSSCVKQTNTSMSKIQDNELSCQVQSTMYIQ